MTGRASHEVTYSLSWLPQKTQHTMIITCSPTWPYHNNLIHQLPSRYGVMQLPFLQWRSARIAFLYSNQRTWSKYRTTNNALTISSYISHSLVIGWTDSNKLQICSVIWNTALSEMFKPWPLSRQYHLIKYHTIICIHEIKFKDKLWKYSHDFFLQLNWTNSPVLTCRLA